MSAKRAVAVVFAVTILAGSLFGQSTEGSILGTVRDSSGRVVVGAKVTVTNAGTNATRTLTTNSVGEYVASTLTPGSYKVAAAAPGFKEAVSTPIQVEISRDIRVDLELQPGAANEVIEVKDVATLADTEDTTLNGVLTNKAITQLPLQGRDFQNLLPLHPGVQRTPGGGFHSVTSNGNRTDDNNYFVDGADDNDIYYGETVLNDAGISGTPASFLPLDSLQEFNTQESPSADYGVKPGVVVNMGLKSGTNDIHGSAYYFHRNSAFDARNFFNPSPETISTLLMHQFGASIGGPIKKDKWFYFLNYEGLRDKVGNPGVTDSPITVSLTPLAGLLPEGTVPADYSIVDAIAGCTAAGTCNPLSLKLANLFLPNSGFTLLSSDPAAINFDFNNHARSDNVVAKTDFVVNNRNVLSARFIYSNTNQVEEDTIPLRPEWLSGTQPRTQVFGVNWAYTPNSQWVNEVRFSFNSFDEKIAPLDSNVNPTTYGLNTGVTDPRLFGFPRINPGSDIFNYMGGNSSWPLDTTPTRTFSFSETASYTHGKHAIRFGGEFRRGSVNYFRAGYGRGRVDFASLEDFVTGTVDRWRRLFGDPGRDVSMKSFGLFFQDDYRITHRLTLNLGLRYDVTYPIKDSRDLLANYVPTEGIVQVGKGISQPYPTNYNNVSPRVGLAWDIFGNGKSVLRAGAGLIFEQPSIRTFMFNGGGLNLNPSGLPGVTPGNGNITSFLQVSSDPSFINWSEAGPIFPSATDASCSVDSQCDVFGVDQHLKTPYVANWNLNLQQQLSRDTLLQIGYVANHGVKLYSVTDINQVNPALDPDETETVGRPLVTNCPAPVGVGTGGPCFPYIGYLTFLSNQASSSYNSLQVTLTKRYSHGLYLLAGYTFAHAIDTATSNLASVPQNSLDYAAERGNGDYDIRNRFTLSVTYDVPSVKSKWQLLEGWQVNGIWTLQGGHPYTLTDANDDISLTGEFEDRWNMVGPPSNIHWSPTTPIPYVDPSSFALDADGHVIGGNPQCIAAASQFGAVDQLANFGCYISGNTVITPPNYGTFGNMGRNVFRGPDFHNLDFSIAKIWRLSERVNLQLRGEVFNLLNHPNFDYYTLNTDLSDATSVGTAIFTPDLGASNPVIGSGGSRHIQLGVKFIW